jgi:hypothetical protein
MSDHSDIEHSDTETPTPQSQIINKDTKNKRKPGRPKKHTPKEVVPKIGVLPQPDNNDNIIEVVYDAPMDFKKIAGFWKSLSAEKIRMEFPKMALGPLEYSIELTLTSEEGDQLYDCLGKEAELPLLSITSPEKDPHRRQGYFAMPVSIREAA